MVELGRVRKGWISEFSQFPTRIYDTNVSGHAKAVYIYLCRRADSEGQSFPGYGTIAEEVGFSKSTIQRAVRELIEAGLLLKEFRGRKESGEFFTNLYTIIHPDDACPKGMVTQTIPPEIRGEGMVTETIPMVTETIRMVCGTTEVDPLTISTNLDDEGDRAHARVFHIEEDERDVLADLLDMPANITVPSDTQVVTYDTQLPTSTPPSAWTNEDDSCMAIDQRMTMHLGRPYFAKGNDYRALKELTASGVSMDFILAGIDYTFATFADRRPRSFAYCAEVIKERWAAEVAKRQPVEAVNWAEYREHCVKPQPSPSPHRTSRTRTSQLTRRERIRDERYAAFYALFPDE